MAWEKSHEPAVGLRPVIPDATAVKTPGRNLLSLLLK